MIPREILIKPCLNGYIVKVGCQTVVFDSTDKLLCELHSYIVDPEAQEKRYRSGAVHREMLLCPPPQDPCPPSDCERPAQQPAQHEVGVRSLRSTTPTIRPRRVSQEDIDPAHPGDVTPPPTQPGGF